ncbi:MAG TPA: SPFH domain-containing protein, partial [Nevskiaceae bacterium]|nr:SPFH domain-containing protein [Nevskiaceae bacterium]
HRHRSASMFREFKHPSLNGYLALLFIGLGLWWGIHQLVLNPPGGPLPVWPLVVTVLSGACLGGLFVIGPNEAQVLQFFGSYVGTARNTGLRWTIPLFSRRKVSVRAHNFESGKLKVNELHGSPIEIGAIIVWQVVDTAKAVFEVEDYDAFVRTQSEAALRGLASRYPYDAADHREPSLRGQHEDVMAQLVQDIQERLDRCGVAVLEARISHLAYAPEIAGAMLQRQQAEAIVAARTRIVDGAVGMVEMALQQLAQKNVVHLDDERKAAMVSNLLVVLCGERGANPVINAGSLY